MNETLNDPTRSGPPLSVAGAGQTLQLSRNEIESLCLKAARGAGMSWGLAEEAGFSAGWLSAQGVDGAGVLARHLQAMEGMSWDSIRPYIESTRWQPVDPKHRLCPVALGATLADYLAVDHELIRGEGLMAGKVSYPGLVLPFVARAAAELVSDITVQLLDMDDAVATFGTDGFVNGSVAKMLEASSGMLKFSAKPVDRHDDVSCEDHHDRQVHKTLSPLPLAADVLGILEALSMRTTVPATPASRADAGAGVRDND